MPSKVDLHIHTTASDGQYSGAEIVKMALDADMRAIAITDHDSTESVESALAAADGTGLAVVPGVEISTDLDENDIHILGFYLDWHHPKLQKTLQDMRASRGDRAQAMVERLVALGKPISWERVREIAGEGAVGRPHIAQALLEAGHIERLEQAFDLYIGNNGPAYIDRYKLEPDQAVRLLRQACGVPVLAHPSYVNNLPKLLPILVELGLAGMEIYYSNYTPALSAAYLQLAKQYGLTVTGGSDFHGRALGEWSVGLGEVFVPIGCIRDLKARAKALGCYQVL